MPEQLPSYVRVQRAKRAAAERSFRRDTGTTGRRFAEYDTDGNMELDFDEFYAMLPVSLRDEWAAADVRTWFDAADLDGNDTLSLHEFWLWSISSAAQHHGASTLEAVLERYDTDKTGALDAMQFDKMAYDTGLGAAAPEMLKVLCGRRGGKLPSHRELALRIQSRAAAVPVEAMNLLTALVWQTSQGTSDEARALQARSWFVTGRDAASVLLSLRKQFRECGAPVADLVKLFDIDADTTMTIDLMEFYNALRSRFGFKGNIFIVEAVFKGLDTDGSGKIGFDELFEFVRGRRHSLDRRSKRVRGLCFKPPSWATYTADGIAWDAETLRAQLQQLLARARPPISSHDAVIAWDRLGTGQLGRKDFVEGIRNFFVASEELWVQEIEPLAISAFKVMASSSGVDRGSLTDGKQAEVPVGEVQRWLDAPASTEPPPLKEGAKKVRPRLSRNNWAEAKAAQEAAAALEAQKAKQRAAERLQMDLAAAAEKGSRALLLKTLRECALDISREEEAALAPNGVVWQELRAGVGWAAAGMEETDAEGPRSANLGSMHNSTTLKGRPTAGGRRRLQVALRDAAPPSSTSRLKVFMRSAPPTQVAALSAQEPQDEGKQLLPGRQWSIEVCLKPGKQVGSALAWVPTGAAQPRRPSSASMVTRLYSLQNGKGVPSPRSRATQQGSCNHFSAATTPRGACARPATAAVTRLEHLHNAVSAPILYYTPMEQTQPPRCGIYAIPPRRDKS